MTDHTPRPHVIRSVLSSFGLLLAIPSGALLMAAAMRHGQPPAGLLVAFAIGAVCCFASLLFPAAKKQSTSHGSARFANVRDVRSAGCRATSGVILGMEHSAKLRAYPNPFGDGLSFEVTKPAPFIRVRTHHVWIEGPTGENKDQSVTYPTLLTDVGTPYLVYDPKGKQHQSTSGRRGQFGPVIRFAPGEAGSPRFNPLDRVRLDTEYEVQDAMRIANILCNATNKEKDNSHYYALLGELLLTTSILHVLHYGKGLDRSLAGVHKLLFSFDRDRDEILTKMYAGRTPHNSAKFGEMKRMFEGKKKMAADDAFGTVAQALRFISLPPVADALSASDFRPEDLSCSEYPTTIYLVIPFGEAGIMRPVIRLLLDQFLSHHELVQDRKKHGRVCYLLNEFPALGPISAIVTSIAQLREYGVQLVLLGQTESQLASPSAYGKDDAQVILDNCKAQLFLGLSGRESTKRLTEVLGKATITQERKTQAVSKKGMIFATTVTDTTGEGQSARELMTQDELRADLGRDEGILLLPGVRPYRVKRPVCYGIVQLQALAELPPSEKRFTREVAA